MSENQQVDLEDIDAMLNSKAAGSETGSDAPESRSDGREARNGDHTQTRRLNARAQFIIKNLADSLTNVEEFHALLRRDQDCGDAIDKDMDDWEGVLDRLESIMGRVPGLSAKTSAAESADASDGISPDNHPIAIGDNDQTINRSQDELLQSIAAQEARIMELEARLQDLAPDTDHGMESTDAHKTQSQSLSDPHVNRLVITINSDKNIKYPLSRNIMTIGREPHNDIQIKSRYISRFHARIVSDQDGCTIEDMESRNGVAVNSHKIRRKQLQSGDLIDLGKIQLKFIDLMDVTSEEGSA